MRRREDGMQFGSGQHGFVLITVMMFLLVMTIIGVSAMDSSTLQERMSANMRDQDISFQAAENALREGEAWIAAQVAVPGVTNADLSGPCAPNCNVAVWELNATEINGGNFVDPNFWDAAVNVRTGAAVAGTVARPLFVVEYVSFFSEPGGGIDIGQPNSWVGWGVFRVTARANGETATSSSVLQSTYSRRYN